MRVMVWRSGVGLAWLLVLAAGLAGCGTTETASGPAAPGLKGARITLAAVGGPDLLKAVASQRGEWEASRGAECAVLDRPVGPEDLGGAQVVVFAGDRLGALVDAGALAVIPEAALRPPVAPEGDRDEGARPGTTRDPADELQFTDVLPAFREQVSRYGRDRMGLPLGGSALVLVVNQAALEGQAVRDAAREARVSLGPPATWPALDALARLLQGRDWNGDGTPDHGIALPLGVDPEGLGDAIVLARAASLGQHPDHFSLLFDADTMEPRIDSPPFVEALARLVELKQAGPPGVDEFDAGAARKAFREGKVALLIDRAELASKWSGPGTKSVRVAPLPGSERVFEPARKVWVPVRAPNRPSYLPAGGGWLVGVSATATGRQREAAIDFARYLVGPETSARLRGDAGFPVLPVRASQVGLGMADPRSAPGVDPRSWSDAVGQTLGAERVVPGLRIPGAEGYLADLSAGRVAAARGTPPEEALRGVAAAWAKRTRSLGPGRQVWHYRRSLNALSTQPRPPARDAG